MAIDHLKSKRFYIQIPHSSHRDHEWMVIAEEMNNDFVSLLAAVLESHVSSCVPCGKQSSSEFQLQFIVIYLLHLLKCIHILLILGPN